jgi:hypothetical protein
MFLVSFFIHRNRRSLATDLMDSAKDKHISIKRKVKKIQSNEEGSILASISAPPSGEG